MPARRRDPVSVPRTFHSSSRPHRHDYGIDESISRAGFFSNAVLEDTDAAAAYSRAKDYDLIRNTHSAIRHTSPDSGITRVGRSTTRYNSLPPVDRKSSPLLRSSLSPTSRSALVPHHSLSHMRSALQAPPPTSLLSTKINSFLKGSSLPPGVRPSTSSLVSYKSYLDSSAPPPPRPSHDSMSIVSYKSHLSDPAISSPFTTRSTSRLYRGFVPSSSSSLPLSRFRSNSLSSSPLPRYNISLKDDQEDDYDYGGSDDYDDDEEEYEPPSYRRKYQILRGRQALPSRPSSTVYYKTGSPAGSDDEDDSYSLVSEDRGTYSYNPRPSGLSPLTLSSYEGPHDGTYEADMADMYDYVPFGPSRQGILELTQHRPTITGPIEILDADDDDEVDENYTEYSPSLYPSPSSSTFLPPLPPPSVPSTSLYLPPSSDLTPPSYSPVSSFSNNALFDSVLSSTAARARAALKDCHQLSNYNNASLVLSVEGSAVSPDGKDRYGFRYYPPPIPLKGTGVGLDERILGVTPKPSTSPADSFFSDYLNRLKGLRNEINDREESRAADARSSYDRSAVSVPRHVPSYEHSIVHMPVHLAGKPHSVPVSSYRSRAGDHGLAHRVDVFPLLESSTTLGKDKLQLPVYRAGGDTSKLTMLEKINIKAAIIGSKMEAEDGGKPKRKLRPSYHVERSREPSAGSSQQSSIFYDSPLNSGGLHSSRPPLPKQTDRKAIRTVDGFTKPKNVMSWEHRVESRISPDDLIYQPQSLSRMREQIRGTREKMDRHRQLLDRYLDPDMKPVTTRASDNTNTSSSGSSAGTDPNNAPMSDLRRRLRRTLAKTKNNP